MYRYYRWWEDKKRKPVVVNKSRMAELLDVSLKTIDDWVRRGAPVLVHGTNGVSYDIDTAAFIEFIRAHHARISIAELRLRDELFDRELFERFG